jgi:hypothetical protein
VENESDAVGFRQSDLTKIASPEDLELFTMWPAVEVPLDIPAMKSLEIYFG